MVRKNLCLVIFISLFVAQVSCSDDNKEPGVKPSTCVWDSSTWDACTLGA